MWALRRCLSIAFSPSNDLVLGTGMNQALVLATQSTLPGSFVEAVPVADTLRLGLAKLQTVLGIRAQTLAGEIDSDSKVAEGQIGTSARVTA